MPHKAPFLNPLHYTQGKPPEFRARPASSLPLRPCIMNRNFSQPLVSTRFPMTRPIFCLMSLVLAMGCGEPSTPAGTAIRSSSLLSAGDAARVAATPAKHAPVAVFINNRKFGDSNGCISIFTAPPETQIKYGSTCGHVGAVSKLTWECLHTDEEGDHYHFERAFPYNEPNQETTSKQVLYTGTELLLFEDEFQKIMMRPASADE